MMAEWVHVKDRTPDSRRLVLVAWRHRNNPVCAHLMTDRFIGGEWASSRGVMYPDSMPITHWTELPAPPDGEEKVHRLTA